MKLCKCGCEKEVIIKPWHKYNGSPRFIRGHNMLKGRIPWNKGKKLPEHSEKIRGEKHPRYWKGKKRPNESKRFIEFWKDPSSKLNSKERSEKLRKWMLENGARIRKQIKNPSKEELNLRVIVKDLYPTSEHTYKVLESRGYEVDNALVKHKIAVEYDGWYHFDTKERRDYHEKRQKEIEQEGWKFIRYTMFDKFPTKEQVEKDIKNLTNKERC